MVENIINITEVEIFRGNRRNFDYHRDFNIHHFGDGFVHVRYLNERRNRRRYDLEFKKFHTLASNT